MTEDWSCFQDDKDLALLVCESDREFSQTVLLFLQLSVEPDEWPSGPQSTKVLASGREIPPSPGVREEH